MVRRARAGVWALVADREALLVRDTPALLADGPVAAAAALGDVHGVLDVLGVGVQNAAAAEVVAELPHQETRHVPPREVRVRKQLLRPRPEARRARVPLDARVHPPLGVAGQRAQGVRLPRALPLVERDGG